MMTNVAMDSIQLSMVLENATTLSENIVCLVKILYASLVKSLSLLLACLMTQTMFIGLEKCSIIKCWTTILLLESSISVQRLVQKFVVPWKSEIG